MKNTQSGAIKKLNSEKIMEAALSRKNEVFMILKRYLLKTLK